MNDSRRQPRSCDPSVYEVRVQGRIDSQWSKWFDDMTVCTAEIDEALVYTTISGAVADQAALLGLLQKLYSLGLPICELRQVGSNVLLEGGK